MAKYSVFKGEISNQSFHDVPSISALISLLAKHSLKFENFRECLNCKKHAPASVNDFVFLSGHRAQTKK